MTRIPLPSVSAGCLAASVFLLVTIPFTDLGAQTNPQGAEAPVKTELKDANSQVVGRAELKDTPNGVLVRLELVKGPAGVHAFHVHETGKCDAPAFTSAGGHFNPTSAQHGFQQAKGPHLGDLPNLHVGDTGSMAVEYVMPETTLSGGKNALLDADGAALVLHAKPDDYRTDPAGAAGDRVACGVITR